MTSPRVQPRPLDLVRSIKVKLGLVVVGSVATTVLAVFLFLRSGIQARFALAGGLLLSLLVIQVLAHGMVLPLRQMVSATKAMAGGDYDQRVTATARDEVGSLARSFNTMAAQLGAVEAQRRELVANVSHELRTPIAALRARLENLADGVEPLDQQAITAMLGSTERLSGLVDQLLELSQFESGAVDLERRPFCVADVVRDATVEVDAVRPDVRIRSTIGAEVAGVGDRDRIREVLTNLLANSIRHSPPDGQVSISAERTPSGLRLEVADEGAGVPPADLERIFERFYRVDASRTSRVGGAGLGLAIARSIIDLHGGSIHAEARAPTGCRMVIDLPG